MLFYCKNLHATYHEKSLEPSGTVELLLVGLICFIDCTKVVVKLNPKLDILVPTVFYKIIHVLQTVCEGVWCAKLLQVELVFNSDSHISYHP